MIYPERFLSRLSSDDRKLLGQQTSAEAVAKYIRRTEKQEHKDFSNWLKLNRVLSRSDRMDKRTSGTVGWPDYELFHQGKVLFLEFKVAGNKLSLEQEAIISRLTGEGFIVAIPQSAAEAIRITRNWLNTFYECES